MHVALARLLGRCQQIDGAMRTPPTPPAPVLHISGGRVCTKLLLSPQQSWGFHSEVGQGWVDPHLAPAPAPEWKRAPGNSSSCPSVTKLFALILEMIIPPFWSPCPASGLLPPPAQLNHPQRWEGGAPRLLSRPSPICLQSQLGPRTPCVPAAQRTAVLGFLQS